MLFTGLLFATTTLICASLTAGEDFTKLNAKYFEQAEFNCSIASDNVTFWILPSGEVKNSSSHSSDVIVNDNGRTLIVNRVNDPDFGYYYCVFTDEYRVRVQKFGLNIDGPYYGPEFSETLKNNAIIGGISAGCTLAVLVGIWIWCAQNGSKRKRKPELANNGISNIDFDNKIENVEENGSHGKAATTKVDDSVYYMADGIEIHNKSKSVSSDYTTQAISNDHQVEVLDSLSTADSGHYQSIGSLGRDASLPNQEEITKLDGGFAEFEREGYSGNESDYSESDLSQESATKVRTESNTNHCVHDAGGTNNITMQSNKSASSEKDEIPSGQTPDLSELYATPIKPKRIKKSKSNDYETVEISSKDGQVDIKIEMNREQYALDVERGSAAANVQDTPEDNRLEDVRL